MQSADFNFKKAMDLNELLRPIIFNPIQEFKVICASCHKKHDPNSETFVTFYGNVCIGLKGGVIGNNFKADGELGRITFLCRKKKCWSSSFFRKDRKRKEKEK